MNAFASTIAVAVLTLALASPATSDETVHDAYYTATSASPPDATDPSMLARRTYAQATSDHGQDVDVTTRPERY